MKRKAVIDALQLAALTAGGDAISPPLFLFADRKLYTCNGVAAVEYYIDFGVEGAIVVSETLKGLTKMKGDEISVSMSKAGDAIVFDDKETTLSMNIIVEDTSLRQQISTLIGISESYLQSYDLTDDFFEGLPLVGYSIFPDMTVAPSLYGVGIKDGCLYSSDNWRISCYDAGLHPDINFSVPKPAVGVLLKADKAPRRLGFDGDKVLVFDIEGVARIYSALMVEDFPFDDVQAILTDSAGQDYQEYEFPKALKDALDVAKVFASDIDDFDLDTVQISMTKGNIVVSGATDQGKISKKIKADKPLPDGVEFFASPEFLKTMLKHTRKFQLGDDVILFKTDNFTQVMQVYTALGKE